MLATKRRPLHQAAPLTEHRQRGNPRGFTIFREVKAIGYVDADGKVFERMTVTGIEPILGRPTITLWEPENVTTETAYSCCGVTKETDKYGIPTYSAYDGLKRRIKTNRLGVTTETVRNGLTTETHRYPESVEASLNPDFAGDDADLVSKTVTNLAGTLRESWTPDPASTTAGGLVKSSSTSVTFNPSEGLSTRSVTTVPGGFKQTTDTYLDGRIATTSGDLAPAMVYTYSVNETGELSTQSYVDGSNLLETTITQTDWAGRTMTTTKGSIVHNYAYYDAENDGSGSRGKLRSVSDSDGVTTLYDYNTRGERTISATDLNANGTIDCGTDTVTYSETVPAMRGSTPVWQTVSKVWQDGDSNSEAGTIVSFSDRTADGRNTWSSQIGSGETTTVSSTPDAGAWTVTTTQPDDTFNITTYVGGLMDVTAKYAAGADPEQDDPIASTAYAYEDSSNGIPGRLHTTTDSRTGPTTTAYLSTTADYVDSITDPGGRLTRYGYDSRGQRTTVTLPDDTMSNTYYTPRGEISSVSGAQTYPVSYTYDYAGRMKTMTTAGDVVTAWNYSPSTGTLTSKRYDSSLEDTTTGTGPGYTYTPAGRLKTRTSARGNHTRYDHDNGGRLTHTRYFLTIGGDTGTNNGNDPATPDIAIAYDALGRQKSISNGLATSSFTYAADLGPDKETITYNLPGQSAFTRVLDRRDRSHGRDTGWELKDGTNVENQVTYGYSATTGFLETVANAADTFTYGYAYDQSAADPEADPPVPAGARVGSPTGTKQGIMPYTLTKSGSPVLQTLRTYEAHRGVLVSIQNNAGETTRSAYDYSSVNGGVNNLGQRMGVRTTFDLGGSLADNPGDTSWGYDDLGQLTSADHDNGTTADRAYQYDTIGNRLFSETGSSQIPATPGTNTTAYDPNALNQYAGTGAISGALQADPVFDDDGNMKIGPLSGTGGSASNHLDWDGENRLVQVRAANNTTVIATYAYDAQSRRISRTVVPATGDPVTTNYIYDGWNLIAEYSVTESGDTPPVPVYDLVKTFTWGLDLSGALQGAGGVGGLLSVTDEVATGDPAYYPTYDGNGNVSEYLDSAGAVQAHYEYDPFGNTIMGTGNKAADFSHRFSTKPLDAETGLYYYGYRYYDPKTGRWPSRDPIEEEGGINLYGFVRNDGVGKIDLLGFAEKRCCVSDVKITFGLFNKSRHLFTINAWYEPEGTEKTLDTGEKVCCDPRRCEPVQLIRGQVVLDGNDVSYTSSGQPLSPDNYTDDRYTSGHDLDPDNIEHFETNDAPGLVLLSSNKTFRYWFEFRFLVKDKEGTIEYERPGTYKVWAVGTNGGNNDEGHSGFDE